MEKEDDYVEVPNFLLQKSRNLQPRLTALIIDSSLVNFCKTIFATLACFLFVCLFVSFLGEFSSVRIIYLVLQYNPHSFF